MHADPPSTGSSGADGFRRPSEIERFGASVAGSRKTAALERILGSICIASSCAALLDDSEERSKSEKICFSKLEKISAETRQFADAADATIYPGRDSSHNGFFSVATNAS